MSRPRKSAELLELNGAFLSHADRRRVDPKPAGVFVDRPPSYLTAPERAVWRELIANMAPGVLQNLDRPVLEIVSRLLAKFRADWLSTAELTRLTHALGLLGASPADRTKISVPVVKPTESFDFLK